MKRHKNSPELSLLKFLPLTYHHSHFLAATLDFTSFFTIAFLRAAHIFLQLGCFGLDNNDIIINNKLVSVLFMTHGVARRLLGPHDTLPCVLITGKYPAKYSAIFRSPVNYFVTETSANICNCAPIYGDETRICALSMSR